MILDILMMIMIISLNIRKNKEVIINKICNEFCFLNKKFILSAIICCPFSGHYTGMIINMSKDFKSLKKIFLTSIMI